MSENQLATNHREQLNALLQTNLTEYHNMLQRFPADMLVDMAEHIAAVAEVFEYLTTQHKYQAGEIEHLLSCANPLDELADAWQVQREDVADMGFILRSYCAEGGEHSQLPQKKPSIHQAMRDAAEQVRNQPGGSNPSKDKEPR